MKKALLTLIAAALMTGDALAQKVPAGGKPISRNLIGIFFEDISYSADGGLNAELVQNNSFEYSPTERDGWGAGTAWRFLRPGHSLGRMEPCQQDALNGNNPNFMRLHVERVGHYYDFDGWTGVGLENEGFDGIPVRAGARYDFSVFMRNVQGAAKDVRAVLVAPGRQPKVLAEASFTVDAAGWTKYSAELSAQADCPNARLQLLVLTTGAADVDMVSLIPQDTYKGHGLRRDLCEALEELNPKFVRFPGGCIVHGGGDGFWDTYRWKTTIGPREQRRGLKNCWGYHQSFGLGYYEYFQLCEDLHAEPLPILPVGVSCQGAGGGWGMRGQTQDAIPMDRMDEWVADALDLIEWANGDVTTPWGRKRAEQGHPEPFGLKYLGLGNEERISPEFEERFRLIYDAVRKAYPDIIVVGTAGPGSHHGNPDYENGWRIADETGLDIIDEHYYEQREYFLDNQHNYDSYPRDRKTKVYLGEYAAKDKKMLDALYEALYLTGVERNGDVVTMTSYAPLFGKKNHTCWNPNLIYFDNERVVRTCSYYVQRTFGRYFGDYFYDGVVSIPGGDKHQAVSCVYNSDKREIYLKLVNAGPESRRADVNLSRFGGVGKTALMQTMQGMPEQENNFETQPIDMHETQIRAGRQFSVDLPPYSFSVIVLGK